MTQIVNITQARNEISALVSTVSQQKKSVVIVRDSKPEAVLIPYDTFLRGQEEQEKEWDTRFERLLKEGKKTFKKWAKQQGISPDTLKEEDVYDLIAKV